MSLARGCVGFLPRSPELLDERIVRPGVRGTADKHFRIAARSLDLRGEPLKIFAGVRRVGQHIDGLLARDRAKLLQSSPRLDAQVRRGRWQLMHEQQPTTRGLLDGGGGNGV